MSIRSFLNKLDRNRRRPLRQSGRRDPSSTTQLESHRPSKTLCGVSIDQLAVRSGEVEGVRRSEICAGDWILVQTRNSLYAICAIGNNRFSVSGGWFDREGSSPHETTIDGCTWGGRAINVNLIAAKGLFLGFGNSVVTTRIRNIQIYRDGRGGPPV